MWKNIVILISTEFCISSIDIWLDGWVKRKFESEMTDSVHPYIDTIETSNGTMFHDNYSCSFFLS